MNSEMHNIEVGSIVKYQGCYYRVSADKGTDAKRWFNLKSIFGNTIYHKRVSASEVVEAQEEWYAKWSKSESYMCM
jgi:hypothetical protein